MITIRRFVAAALMFAALPLLSAHTAKAAQMMTAKPSASATTGDKLDITTATADQLTAFNGIGDAYAKRIIDGRPYTMKTQLVSKGVLPQATYNKIKDNIIASKVKK